MGFLGRFVRRKTLLGFGMIWQSIANSFAAISRGFGQILTSRTLAGVGSSPQHPTGASYIAETFSKRKVGRALGLNIVAAQVGSLVAPLAGSLLVLSLGWRTTLLAFSIPGMLVGIMFLFVAESKRSQKWSGISSLRLLFREARGVLSNKTVLAVMVVQTVMAFRTGARDFLPSYFTRDLGITSLGAGILFTVLLTAGLPAPYFWGYVSDKLERRKVLMFATSAACILWCLLSCGWNNLFQLLLILVPLGFVGQGVGGVVQAYVAEATSQENRDLIYGIYFTLAYTLGSFAPAILGYFADSFGFQASFLYVALVSLSAAIAAYFLR